MADRIAASTTFRFDLPRAEAVRLEVFDLGGRRVAKLRDAWTPAGRHSLDWNRRDANGASVRPGAYVYRLTAGSFRAHKKLVVLPWALEFPTGPGERGAAPSHPGKRYGGRLRSKPAAVVYVLRVSSRSTPVPRLRSATRSRPCC